MTFPYHTTPTASNWRNLCLALEAHIAFIRQGLRIKRQGPRYHHHLTMYPRCLHALHIVEAASGFRRTSANPEQYVGQPYVRHEDWNGKGAA